MKKCLLAFIIALLMVTQSTACPLLSWLCGGNRGHCQPSYGYRQLYTVAVPVRVAPPCVNGVCPAPVVVPAQIVPVQPTPVFPPVPQPKKVEPKIEPAPKIEPPKI